MSSAQNTYENPDGLLGEYVLCLQHRPLPANDENVICIYIKKFLLKSLLRFSW